MEINFLRPFLQTLCCNSPWNYAVFWKLKHQDEMVLAWEDGFCNIPKPRDAMMNPVEDLYFKTSNMVLSSSLTQNLIDGTPGNYLVGFAVAEMSRATHAVGKGVVGEAAFTGNACWIYSDNIQTDVLNSILLSKYPDEWLLQFAAGIKTILLLPVIPDGVLQLGSLEMVAEDAALVAHVKNMFETYKESDGFIQQYSLMPAIMDNLEEPLTVSTDEDFEDQSYIDAVRIEDPYLIANQMVPVFMFQDLCNASERHLAYDLEDVAEGEINLQSVGMVHVSEPSQLSFADHEDEILKFYHEEKPRASPHCYELNTRMCGDFGSLDFHFEEGITEPIFEGSYFDNIYEAESNLFNSPVACEPDKALGSTVQDKPSEHIYGASVLGQNVLCYSIGDSEPSCTVDVSGVESGAFPAKEVEEEHIFGTVANACSYGDEDSSDKSIVTSINISSSGLSKSGGQIKHGTSVKEDQVPWNISTPGSMNRRLDAKSNFSASVSSDESKISSLSDKQQKRKGHDSMNRGKSSRLSTISKKRARTGDNQRPRPRDRQLIQDRIKELRELVPNSEKSSIDGLLDKTIKHMLFLRNVTNQADKLRHPILREEVDENTTKPAEVDYNHRDGTSWAVELGSDQHFCPIIVKDLHHPGHMLIEVVCTDHDHFLEITDVIHRLKLTILKGVMDEMTDRSSWARFIVETPGSFHRLDIFWPLMQLLQKDRKPVSTNS